MFLLNGKLINTDAPYTTEDSITYSNLRSPEVRTLLNVEEVVEDPAPEDYSEETYYRTEDWNATQRPYVVYTKKSTEQLNQLRRSKLTKQIADLEQASLLPRVSREFMLLQFAAVAAQQGVDSSTNFAYNKVKELDDTITALRTELNSIPA